jgi:ubiquinone biosynthesis protein UbiJ
MFAEYWLEEEPLIAKKTHLAQFARDVDALREDAERLEKRLERLEQSRG